MGRRNEELADLFLTCRTATDFPSLAHTLLTRCHLVVESSPSSSAASTSAYFAKSAASSSSRPSSARRFALSDVEFYHFDPPGHPDPFAHAHDSQVQSGTWYFHAAGTGAGFKEGSYKGLDVTFGSPESRSGILIRRITEILPCAGDDACTLSATSIDGPSLVCDTVLEALGFLKVRDLVAWLRSHSSKCGLDAVDSHSPLRLELVQPTTSASISPSPSARVQLSSRTSGPTELSRIWACPRHGLSLKKAKTIGSEELRLRLEYVAKPYRFLSARPKNGAINLTYAVLLHVRSQLSDASVSSSSASTSKATAPTSNAVESGRGLATYAPAVVELLHPFDAAETGPHASSPNTTVLSARKRALRTVTAALESFEKGRSKHPSRFAGSGMATTRDVGELYGSLLDWDGRSAGPRSSIVEGGKQTGGAAAAAAAPAGPARQKRKREEDESARGETGGDHNGSESKDGAKCTFSIPRTLRALRRAV